ncbi:unnamed protein product [Rhizoctonia solani]|uniref:CCHC-type domain-containing protein n=1 Tax=Rhizoctonia solani TaxID=456999 RepID=A0A8H3GWJ5_9AGAM|nr:unnamed protein product [Rhizoctonia solani]
MNAFAAVDIRSVTNCSYGAVPNPPADTPENTPPPQRERAPPSPRGIRRPIDRDTPSNVSIRSRSTLSPPPPPPPVDVPLQHPSNRDTPNPFGTVPTQEDNEAKIRRLQSQLATMQQLVRQHDLDNDPLYVQAEAEVRTQPSVSEIRRRPVAPGVLAPAIQAQVSPTITHIFKTGWKLYVPISMLTTCYRQLNSMHYHTEMNIIRWNNKGQALVKDATRLPDAGDYLLTIDEWVDGWKCHLWLIEKYQPDVAQAWADHYSLIFHDPTFHTEFDLWLCYDITVRKRWVDEHFDPGTFQKKIYKMIDRELTRAARDGLTQSLTSNHTHHHDSHIQLTRTRPADPLPQSSDLRHSNRPGPSRLSGNRHNTAASARYHPYKHSNPLHTHSTNHTASVSRCLRCGGSGHPPPSCNTSTRANDDSATTSTEPKAAMPPAALTDLTSAPFVAPLATRLSPAPIDPCKIVTPLIPDAWHAILLSLDLLDKFPDVPDGLRHGFRFGASRSLSTTSIPPNHKSAQDAPDIIDAHIAKELSLNRYSGPFDRATLFNLIGHFRSAPLGLVSKASSPGQYRMVQDFSYSHTKGLNDSVNDEIDIDEFPCVWGFFDDVVQTLLDLPPASMAATFDVDAAYRRIPIHPDDQPSMVVSWKDSLYLDHCAPFGAASSNGLFARCGDAMLLILAIILSCRVLKWVDDYLIIRPPPGYPGGDTTEQHIYNIARPLGWPWKIAKTKNFDYVFEYLGFLWDIPGRSVSIPPKKREKFLAKINAWISSDKVTLKLTQQLIGSLVHCTNLIHEGRAWLAGLIQFSTSFPHTRKLRFITRPKPDYAARDALWWKERLNNECTNRIAHPPPVYHHHFYMDASTSFGITIIVNNRWAAWRLMQGWKSDHRDIGWAEMSALELTLEAAITCDIHDATLHFHSDNQGVVFAMAAGRSRNTPQNEAIKRIYARASIFGLRIRTSYIASSENPADPPSRGIPTPNMQPMDWPIPVPHHLSDFIAPAPLI